MNRSKRILYLAAVALCFILTNNASTPYNINIIGHVNTMTSWSRHTTSFIECLHPDIPVTIFKTSKCSAQGFPEYFKKVIDQGVPLYDSKALSEHIKKNIPLTGITIYADSVLWKGWEKYKRIPNKSTIKFAYCVTERTLVTDQDPIVARWISKLNNNFDALLVPDEWLIDTFKNVGVKIPIFTLPEALNLNSLLEQSIKNTTSKPFVFGFSGGCYPHKNHKFLIQAFAQEFGNDSNVRLVVHSRFGAGFQKIVDACQQANVSNIILEQKSFSRPEYEQFIRSLDCYVTISKGEGFSIIPREALAAGIPCIVSNNTAQTTICNSGCVYSVPSNILEPSSWLMAHKSVGFDYNSSIDDVKNALRIVYQNHQHYRDLALKGREWVKQYLAKNLSKKYKTLVAPSTVILGDRNEITEHALITNSKELFKRYKILCNSKQTKFITS